MSQVRADDLRRRWHRLEAVWTPFRSLFDLSSGGGFGGLLSVTINPNHFNMVEVAPRMSDSCRVFVSQLSNTTIRVIFSQAAKDE